MKNIQLIISYDGTHFLGWQKTPLGPSVEEALEKALSKVLQEKVYLQAASRTDASVHAEGQSVNFFTFKKDLSLKKLLQSLNCLLPPYITALEIEQKPLPFHPTLDNKGKEYQYFVCNSRHQKHCHRSFSWHVRSPLNLEAMEKAAVSLLGTHDFSAFCNKQPVGDKDPICTVYSIKITKKDEDRLCFSIIGDRFLYKMMRNLIGTLVYVGLEKLTPCDVKDILSLKKRTLAGITAPAHGLYLMQVLYQKPS